MGNKAGPHRGPRLPNQEGPRRKYFRGYIVNAKRRGLQFNLSFESFTELTAQSCFWCGDPPSQILQIRWKTNGFVREQLPWLHGGIDRLDNACGYIEGNCVPCCKTCNAMRSAMSTEEFMKQIHKIAQHTKRHG
jgi:phage FluMu protein Com